MDAYVFDWLNLLVRWLAQTSKGARPLATPPIQTASA
jgi:hypothetical protein